MRLVETVLHNVLVFLIAAAAAARGALERLMQAEEAGTAAPATAGRRGTTLQ